MPRCTFQKEIKVVCDWCDEETTFLVRLWCITNEPLYRNRPDWIRDQDECGDELYFYCPECGNLKVIHYKPDAYEVFMKKQMQRTRFLQRQGNPDKIPVSA